MTTSHTIVSQNKFDRHKKQLELISKLESVEIQEKELKALLSDGLNVLAKDSLGYTHLHWACYSNSATVVKFLLDHRADPNSKAKDDTTPIHCAVTSRKAAAASIVQLLMAYGADSNFQCKGELPIDKAADAKYDCFKKDLAKRTQIVTTLLSGDTKPTATSIKFLAKEKETKKEHTVSVKEAKLTSAEQLLKDGIMLNNLGMVKEALEQKADFTKKDQYGKSLFMLAIDTVKDIEIIRALLLAGANVNEQTQSGYTPLHNAAYKCDLPLIELLLEFKANVNSQSYNGSTPLHCVCDGSVHDQEKLIKTADRLIKANADINLVDRQGNNPMRWAAYWQYSELVEFLIRKGSTYTNTMSFTSPSPLTRGNTNVGAVIAKAIQNIELQDRQVEKSENTSAVKKRVVQS